MDDSSARAAIVAKLQEADLAIEALCSLPVEERAKLLGFAEAKVWSDITGGFSIERKDGTVVDCDEVWVEAE